MKSRIPTFVIGLVIPVFLVLGLFPFWNRIEPFVLGFPFDYFWLFLCMLIIAGCLWLAYKLDPLNDGEDV